MYLKVSSWVSSLIRKEKKIKKEKKQDKEKKRKEILLHAFFFPGKCTSRWGMGSLLVRVERLGRERLVGLIRWERKRDGGGWVVRSLFFFSTWASWMHGLGGPGVVLEILMSGRKSFGRKALFGCDDGEGDLEP